MSDQIINWAGWFIVNAIVLPLAPWVGMKIMAVINQWTVGSEQETKFVVDFFAPYKEGQLGYVALGYFGLAAIELTRAFIKDKNGWWAVLGIVSFALAMVGMIVAAFGAAVKYKDTTAKALQDSTKTNVFFKVSRAILVVEFGLTAVIHIATGA